MSDENLDDLGKEMEEALKSMNPEKPVDQSAQASETVPESTGVSNPAPAVMSLKPEGVLHGLDFLLDIPLSVSVELGNTKMFVRDVCNLGQGSIIELNRTAEDYLDILVNGRVIAKGEVVVVNDKFGIRIVEIITPQQRIEQLR